MIVVLTAGFRIFIGCRSEEFFFRFGDGRDCVEDELEDLWFRLDIRQLFYAPKIAFRTLYSSQAKKDYEAKKTPPSAILLVLVPVIAEILEVANNPNLNKNRGSTVRGDR